MKRTTRSQLYHLAPVLFISLLCRSVTAAPELTCSSQDQATFAAAQRAQNDGKVLQARELYQQAAGSCGKAGYWLALGDLLAGGAFASTANASEDAVEAFGNAFDAARREKDRSAGGAAARAIVQEGLKAGDPIKANSWLVLARQLEAGHSEIPDLERRVDAAMAELTPEEIEIGFSDTRGAGKANRLLHGNTGPSNYWDNEPQLEDPTISALEVDPLDSTVGGAGAEQPEAAPLKAISIPIRFEYNSAEATAETATNIRSLATVLAAQPQTTSITLIGHADVRGDAAYNLRLSAQRATRIKEVVESLQPTLHGRIRAIGRGEAEPIDTGNSDRAHANNRRLEITLSK